MQDFELTISANSGREVHDFELFLTIFANSKREVYNSELYLPTSTVGTREVQGYTCQLHLVYAKCVITNFCTRDSGSIELHFLRIMYKECEI